ncbi:MAG: TonB-dependent receptor plug domain-containing protein [Gemmatimonadetes bacterium]|nr:TonB-dependent receptor plug domain-containing protein [Gemmatimonadota bacterium]
MKRRMPFASMGLGVMLSLGGCLGSAVNSVGRSSGAPERVRVGNAQVIDAEHLAERGGDLLSAIASRVANLRVHRTSHCPEIRIRGTSSIQGPSDPKIYVDGQPAANTCILDMMDVTNVLRVEVYPMGVRSRPGYLSHPHGLILVFLRDADS